MKALKRLLYVFFLTAYSIQAVLGLIWAALETVKTRDIPALLLYVASVGGVFFLFEGEYHNRRTSLFAAHAVLTMPMLEHIFWGNSGIVQELKYLLFLFCPMLIIWLFRQRMKNLLIGTILFTAVICIIVFAVNGMTVSGLNRSIRQSWFSRISYIRLDRAVEKVFGDYPEVEQNVYNDDIYFSTKRIIYADEVKKDFCDYIERTYGMDTADRIYAAIERESFSQRGAQIIKETLWDMAGYMFAPPVVLKQLGHFGYENLTGRNYEHMRRNSPVLSKGYYFYGIYIFIIFGIISVIYFAANTLFVKDRRRSLAGICLLLFIFAATALILSLRGAGLFDYRLTCGILALESIFIVSVNLKYGKEG